MTAELIEAPMGGPRLGLRRRVWLITALVVAVVVTVVSLTAFLFVRSQTEERFNEDLLARARTMSSLSIDALDRISPAAFGDDRVAVLDARGDIVASTPHGPPIGAPELAVASGSSNESIRAASQGGVQFEVVAEPSLFGGALVLASSTAPVKSTLRTLAIIFTLIGTAGIVFAAVIALLTARAGLRPVQRLTEAAQYVARTEDLTPIPVLGDDELARLAEAFNTMLVALDRSRTQQRQFIADAGHELKTPLTSLRTNLDLLAQAASTPGTGLAPAERAAMLDDARAQIGELTGLVTDLVELARDHDGPGRLDGIEAPADIADVTRHAVERVRRRAPSITFETDTESWYVDGDPAALERAITNLLDNAAKFSPEGGTVRVTQHGGTLTVTDHGAGISEQDLPHIFDRFYRSIDARSTPGSGLGLAIVAQVVHQHGGTVRADSTPRGTTFSVELPGTASSDVPGLPALPVVPQAVERD